jgi:hypothetical protein
MAHALNKTTADGQKINRDVAGEGVAQAGLSIILTLTVVVGVWSVVCMIGGLVNTGGIGQLARAWFASVTGM